MSVKVSLTAFSIYHKSGSLYGRFGSLSGAAKVLHKLNNSKSFAIKSERRVIKYKQDQYDSECIDAHV